MINPLKATRAAADLPQAEAASPQAEWEAATQNVVRLVGELLTARTRLRAAESEYLRTYGKQAPDSFSAQLFATADALLLSWKWHRHELVGAPEPETREQQAINECRAALQRAKEMTGKYEAMLREPGKVGDKQLLALACDWAGNVSREQQRLAELLARLPQTSETRRERLDLAEAVDKGTSITLLGS